MKKLIIAEKPSLGKNVAGAIQETFQNHKGYKESNSYIVSWAFGHLFELVDMQSYQGLSSTKWSLTDLPFFPKDWRFKWRIKDDNGIKEQFSILKILMNRADVDTIIHCGDADREGEVIVRMIIKQGLKDRNKSIMRLWLPEQTEKTIREALNKLKPDSEYDDLYQEGIARTYIDWLYGINLTRYLTLKSNTLLRVGRVLTPIVKAIYERDKEIKNFVPHKYLKAESKCIVNNIPFILSDKEKYELSELDKVHKICNKYNLSGGIVESVERKIKVKNPPKLFSLSKLQGLLGKKYKIPLKQSLEIIQKLYEAGYVTYPRTNTEYLSENEVSKVDNVLRVFREKGYSLELKKTKRIFDDSKIESHSAITPTYKVPSAISDTEQKVYNTIKNRFLAVFCANQCKVSETAVNINIAGNIFTIKGMSIVQQGWLEYEGITLNGKIIPDFNKGDKINVNFKPEQKETTPPKKYTTASLGEFLKNPFSSEKKLSDDEEYKAILSGVEIGTEATRTMIIDKAISNKFIACEKDVYSSLPLAEGLVNALDTLKVDMSKEKTVELSKKLKQVYHKNINVKNFLSITQTELTKEFENKDIDIKSLGDDSKHNSIGVCPLCGGNILLSKNSKNYYCSNYKDKNCKFIIWKSIAGKALTDKQISELLKLGKTNKISGFKKKAGGTFSAKLILNKVDGKINFKFD